MVAVLTDDARRRHYGEFYGLDDIEGPGPIAVVIGNCQAESLRLFLGAGLRSVRVPAVHELTVSDLPHLDRLLARTDVLVTQPIRDDYHGMPLGSAQTGARLAPGAAVVTFPVIRFAGLYPAHAIIRPPSDPSMVPPIVEYHDFRTLAEAADRAAGRRVASARIDVATVRAVAQLSLSELRRREIAHGTLPVSDLFERPSFAQMRTLNHPGNAVWQVVAARLGERLGLSGGPADPGRPVLNGVHAPREEAVIEAWGSDASPTTHWTVDGKSIDVDEIRQGHLEWYAEHPDVVSAGIARHGETLHLLGLD